MAHQHSKGPIIPDAGDRIIESIDKMVSTSGLVRAVATTDEARNIVKAAKAAGNGPTAGNPMYFLVHNLLLSSTGETAGGLPVLHPSMTVDFATANSTVSGVVELSAGNYRKLCDARIEARPYQRVAFAIGSLWGVNATAQQYVDLEVWMNGIKGRSRLGSWDDSTSAHCLGVIPANTVPDCSMWLLGAGPNGTKVTVSADDWSKLSVMAFPCPAL